MAPSSGATRRPPRRQHKHSAEKAYGTAQALFADPAIDIVTVAVKVPDHRELVLAAAASGKHLYCEWPLGRDLAEAEVLAAAARAAGIHAAIGLQTRMNPAAQRARAMIASGAIGRVLSAHVLSTTMAFGPAVEPAMAFAEDGNNGVTLVTVQGAHTFDFAVAMLSAFSEISTLATTQFPHVTVGDSAVTQTRATFDHVLLQGRLASGSPVSIEVAGERSPDATPFTFEVVGEQGTILLDGGAPRGFQSGRLRLLLNGTEQPIENGELSPLADEAVNVAGVYAALRDDIINGTFTIADFDHAVRLSRFVDDALVSSDSGARMAASRWPGQA